MVHPHHPSLLLFHFLYLYPLSSSASPPLPTMLPTVLVAAAAILGVVQATWSGSSKSDDSLCYKPYYNAPKAPWEKGCSPGWFEGSNKPSQGSYHGKPWSQIVSVA